MDLTNKLKLLSCALLAVPLFAQGIFPNSRLTPGAIISTDRSVVCRPGYSRTVRHTSGRLKHFVYVEYGLGGHHSGRYEVDHLVPLSLGGADVRENLWPQSYSAVPGAHEKDELELAMYRAVCYGHMPLREAQAVFLRNWVAGYNKFVKGKR